MKRSLLIILTLLAALAAAPASAQTTVSTDRCPPVMPGPTITVSYLDRPIRTDETQNIEHLTAMGGKAGFHHHHVLGLTYALPDYRLAGNMRISRDEAGRICAVPDIAVTLSLSELTVYLAREITDSCRRQIIREHEAEHVRVWQQYLRAGARLLEIQLRQELAAPLRYPSAAGVEESSRQWITYRLGEKMKLLSEEILATQREIDSPASYAQVSGRLRTCPPAP